MTDYTYNPQSGTCVDPDGNTVPIANLTAADTLTFGPNATTGPYAVTLPSTLTIGSLIISGPGGPTITVPTGGTLNANVTVNGGRLNVGTVGTQSTATTTVNGSINVTAAYYYPIKVNGNVFVTGQPGATITLNPNNPYFSMVLADGAQLTSQNPIVVTENLAQQEPGTSIELNKNSSLVMQYNVLAGSLTPVLNSLPLPLSGAPYSVTYTGTYGNGVGTLRLAPNPDIGLKSATITRANVVISPLNILTGTTLQDATTVGDLTIPSGATDTFTNESAGTGTIFDLGSMNLSGLTYLVDPLTIDLEPGSQLAAQGGFGEFAAGTAINVFGPNLGMTFDSLVEIDGALNILSTGTAYTETLQVTASGKDNLVFAAGSSVNIGLDATLEINAASYANDTTIQLAGGGLLLDQAPATFGTVQFYTGNSTVQLGSVTATTAFAVTGTLLDFSDSDAVIFNGAVFGAAAKALLTGNTLTVTDQNGVLDGSFTLLRSDAQTYVQNDFTLVATADGMALETNGVSALAAPVVSAGGTATFTAPDPPVVADATLTVTDPASATLVGATVSITSNFLSGDTLGFVNQNGITGSFNETTGVLALSGTASVAQYQAALDSVTYGFTPGADPTAGGGLVDRTLSWSVNDGSVTSLAATSGVDVVFNPPTLTVGGTISYAANDAAIVLDPAVAISDANAALLTGATIAVAGGLAGDLLAVNVGGTAISPSWDPNADVLTLSGTDTLADYQAALATVAFSSSAADPTDGGLDPARGFSWSITDAASNSASGASFAAVACFAQGSRIATHRGDVAVESLRVGDLVLTQDGSSRPIVWLGHRHVDCQRHPRPRDVWPVKVCANAFAQSVPRQDLYLSPDHAIFAAGILVPVKHLINGMTIVQQQRAAITYWHVELVRQDVLLAEGLPCESYLDTGTRAAFANGGRVVAVAPDFAARTRDGFTCAEVVVTGRDLDAVRDHLASRASLAVSEASFSQPVAVPECQCA